MQISVQNLSSQYSDESAQQLVAALNKQMTEHYNASCWVKEGHAEPVEGVVLIAKGQPIPDDSGHLELLDHSDQPGALGYHEEQAFKKGTPDGLPEKARAFSARGLRADNPSRPLMRVFVETTLQDGASVPEVASHEALEAAVDPRPMKEPKLATVGDRIYIVEVGDPVQDTPNYTIDVGGGVTVQVANFTLPAYYGLEQSTNPEQYDWCSVLKAVAPAMTDGGYISFAPVSEPENWQQSFGSEQANAAV